MMFHSAAHWAIVIGLLIVAVAAVEGVRAVSGKANG